MVTLLWQTALLLLGAYFLGAFFGCMFRRLLSPASEPSKAGRRGTMSATGNAGPVAAGAGASVAQAPDRFSRALTGESLAGQRAEEERAEYAARAASEYDRVEPKIETIAAALPERSVTPSTSTSTSPASSVAPIATPATPGTNPPAAIQTPGLAGAATATAAALGAAAYNRAAPAAAPRPNDLEDIRGIDAAIADRLNDAGIKRWDQIAAWQPSDVARFDTLLTLGGKIWDENWIEQASILAAGGSTAYAARRALGEADVVEAPAVGGWKPRLEAAAPVETESNWTTAAVTSATAAMVATTLTPAAAAIAPEPEVVAAPEPPVPEAEVAAVDEAEAEPETEVVDEVRPSVPFPISELPRAAGTEGSAVVAADVIHRDQEPEAEVESWASEANSEVQEASPEQHDEERWQWNADDVAAGRELTDDDTTTAGAVAGAAALAAAAAAAADPTGRDADEPAANVVETLSSPPEGVSASNGEPLTGLQSVRSAALVGDHAMPFARDDLKRIRGLGVRDETQLRALGITTYEQIANWSADDAAAVESGLNIDGRIVSEKWIEQAKVLLGLSTSAYAERRDRGLESTGLKVETPPVDPAPLARAPAAEVARDPVIPESDQTPFDERQVEAPAEAPGEPQRRGFSDQIQSLGPLEPEDGIAAETTDRTEVPEDEPDMDVVAAISAAAVGGVAAMGGAAASDDATTAAPTVADAGAAFDVTETDAVAPAIAPTTSDDDLKRIRGIGVLIEKKLNAMGYVRYEQIANWTQEDISAVNAELAFQNRIEREKWIEQARILSTGGETEFSRRIDSNGP